MPKQLLVFFFALISQCSDDLDLGMKYQKVPVFETAARKVYCYHLSWGLDGEAYYISANDSVCNGFDSTKDICFSRVSPEIFFKVELDTLKLYTSSIPSIPKNFPLNIQLNILQSNEEPNYENKFINGTINKISFDRILLSIPCEPVPYSTPENTKFKN